MKKQRLHAVSDVSFALHKGELLGIVGESGCGKSTLVKMLVGSLPVSSGEMELSGVDYAALKGKEKESIPKKDPDGLSGSLKLLFTAYEDRDISGRAAKKL